MTDEQFKAQLKKYLGDGPLDYVPVEEKTDGTIDRGKTLALPCYKGIEINGQSE